LSLPSGIEIPLSSRKNVEFGIMQLKDLLEELKKDESTDDESDLEMKDENTPDESDSNTSPSET